MYAYFLYDVYIYVLLPTRSVRMRNFTIEKTRVYDARERHYSFVTCFSRRACAVYIELLPRDFCWCLVSCCLKKASERKWS